MTRFVLSVVLFWFMCIYFACGFTKWCGLSHRPMRVPGALQLSRHRMCFSTLTAAKTTILGDNLIECRDFSLTTAKIFEYVNSYKTLNSMPALGLPEFAFIGRSNVGKSTLINTLTGMNKKVATAGKTPGTTKCINLFSCKDKAGPICNFVDLPGYGFAKLSKVEQQGISSFLRDYFLARGALKLVFLLVDSRRKENTLDQEMFSFLADHGVPVVIVATKVDKLSKIEAGEALDHLRKTYCSLSAQAAQRHQEKEGEDSREEDTGTPGGSAVDSEVPIVLFSSKTGVGKSEIWRTVRDSMLYSY